VIDGHPQIVSDMFPEQPSARGLHRIEHSTIKRLPLVGELGRISIK
jgi:hypothetical protein